MSKYLLVDTANTFFRARHIAHRGADTWDKLGIAVHITLNSVLKSWQRQKPNSKDLATHSDLKIYLKEWDKLCLKKGVLYRKRKDAESQEEVVQLVLPESERARALKGLHDDIGHLGRDRTLNLVRARFFWPKMAESVQQKVRNCEKCIKRKMVKFSRGSI